MNGAHYSSPELFNDEIKTIFPGWICVGTTNELPSNGSKVFELYKRKTILVIRKDNSFEAFYNSCRHRGAQLRDIEDLFSNSSKIICPYHSWCYDLDGKLVNAPRCEDTPKLFLKKLRCTIVHNLIWVSEKEPEPLQLGRDAPDLLAEYNFKEYVSVYETTIEIQANWKLLVSNFNCYYHLAKVHPWLHKRSKIDNHHHISTDSPNSIVFKTDPITEGEPFYFDQMGGSGRKDVGLFFVFFPNVFIFAMRDHAFIVTLIPQSESKTIEKAQLLVHPSKADNKQYWNSLLNYYTTTNNEDIDICLKTQKGVSNFYPGGTYIEPFESAVKKFDTLYLSKL